MKKTLLLLGTPLLLFAHNIDFFTSLEKTLQNNKGLKAKKLEIDKAKLSLQEAKSYDYGSLVFAQNISRTNNAGYVFGMKLASREANFGDFGFSDFMGAIGGAAQAANGDFGTFSQMLAQSGDGILAMQPDDLNNPDARTNFETKATYKVPIFTGFKLQNAKKMAKLQILANQAKYTYNEKSLGLEVLKAYNGAVAAKEFIKATQTAKKATNSFVEFATELYDEGLVTDIDVKQAKVYDMGVDAKMLEAKNSYQLALAYLRFLTADNEISDVESFQNIFVDISSLDSLKYDAYRKRDDFAWMKYNTDTMKTKIDFDSSDYYPTIGAQLEYGFNDNKLNNLSSDKDYYMGAIGLSYNLFDGNLRSVKKQKAKVEYAKTKHYFDYMKSGIKLEVEKNYLTLVTKQKVLKQKQKALSLSDEVLVKSQEMYKNHLMNMSTLLMQQANRQKANAEVILAKYEETLASASLKIALGDSLKNTK